MSTESRLANLVNGLSTARVLTVGDVMLDRFVYGTVDRISPEAPVPVLRVERERTMLGGAGNVARNLTALGAECCFVAVVGTDRAGRDVARLLGEETGVESHLLSTDDRETTVKMRFVAGSQQLLRTDQERTGDLDAELSAEVLSRAKEDLSASGALVLSDYGKGVLEDAVVRSLIDAAPDNMPIIVDPKGRDFSRYRGATMVTPNRRELSEATGLPVSDDASVVAAATKVMRECGIASVLVTRSQDGMTLVSGDPDAPEILDARAVAREVFDVSGAGDTVVAALAAALAAGFPMADAVELANTAAGIVVGKMGTAVATRDELAGFFRAHDLDDGERKLLTLDALQERVLAWRAAGLSVGFTNGCFDLLHPGHVSLLRQSRAACDRLVVAINSDSSVQRLKGPERPVQPETARALVLGSLADVDAIAIFDDETPLRLIETLKPDLLVKGADYRFETTVGAPEVVSWGGRVMFATLEAGHSTTNTIRRLAATG